MVESNETQKGKRAVLLNYSKLRAEEETKAMKQTENTHLTTALSVKNLSAWYGSFQALENISLDFYKNNITAIIGPSGCGKSTFLRCLNRMNDFIPDFRAEGEIKHEGNNLLGKKVNPIEIRLKIGMVFQKPNPFPKSIYENIAYGPKICGVKKREELDQIVEKSLTKAYLWDDVKDKLHKSALDLSGGQQQRLCISRAIAMEPDIILLDEPCSALDPIATNKIEELMRELKQYYTLIIVTHNMQQASRISDYTAFMYLGKLIEFNNTQKLFTNPENEQTSDYVTGRFG